MVRLSVKREDLGIHPMRSRIWLRTPDDARMTPGFLRAAIRVTGSIYFSRPDFHPDDVRVAFF